MMIKDIPVRRTLPGITPYIRAQRDVRGRQHGEILHTSPSVGRYMHNPVHQSEAGCAGQSGMISIRRHSHTVYQLESYTVVRSCYSSPINLLFLSKWTSLYLTGNIDFPVSEKAPSLSFLSETMKQGFSLEV